MIPFAVPSPGAFRPLLPAIATVSQNLKPAIRCFESGLKFDFFEPRGTFHRIDVGHPTASEAARVIVVIRADVVASGPVAVSQFRGRSTTDECLQVLVHRGQADAGQLGLDGKKDFFRGGVMVHGAEVFENRCALLGELMPLLPQFLS